MRKVQNIFQSYSYVLSSIMETWRFHWLLLTLITQNDDKSVGNISDEYLLTFGDNVKLCASYVATIFDPVIVSVDMNNE